MKTESQLLPLFLIGLVMALATASSHAATNMVRMGNYWYNPTNITINAADSVLWTNASATPHDTTANSGLWASPTFGGTTTYTFKFNNAGYYPYICGVHIVARPEQTGTVTVVSSSLSPTISITSPVEGQDFSTPASFAFSANASDSDGSVTNVQFFAGATLLGSDTTSPYSIAVSNLAAGSYTLTAKATDNSGLSTTSSLVRIVVGTSRLVKMGNYWYAPTNITVNPGDSVVWTNVSATAHDTTANSGLWASPTFGGVNTYSFRFTNAGYYPYICGVHIVAHPEQTGTVSVAAAANVSPTVTITTPANGAVLTAPASFTLAATTSDSDGTVSQVEFLNGATSLGVDTTSSYNATVSSLVAGGYTFFAVVTDNLGAKATNSVSIIVNAPPTASLTSPTNSASFLAPAGLTLTATAGDTDGTVTNVEFFNGATKLGEDNSSPYSFAWSSVVAGSYTLTVKATDNRGATITSSAITISVTNNAAPTVAISNPTNGAVLTAPASFTLQASSADSDGTVSQVEFLNGAASLSVDMISPYSASVGSLVAGSYTFSAVATDNLGAKATNSVSIIINAPPTASLTSPTNGASFLAPASLTLTAAAGDADGTVTNVEFFNGATKMGEDNSSPYSFAWNGVVAGGYTLTVKATDNRGATVTSSAITISVTNNAVPIVAISNPTNGAVLTAPASFILQASASDSDGTVSQVEFLNGATSLSVDTTSPYSASVGSLTAGSYTFSGVATDNLGAKATNSVSIIVNAPPTASLTSPTNGAMFVAPANVTLTGTAGDTDGTVTNVKFFTGAMKLGEDNSSPYGLTWSNVVVGTYSLSVQATDNRGAIFTSGSITVTVTNSPPTPVVMLNPVLIGGDFIFSFASQTGRSYEVQYTDALNSDSWHPLATLNGNGSTINVTNESHSSVTRFFRIESK